jgi:hypothetical protein
MTKRPTPPPTPPPVGEGLGIVYFNSQKENIADTDLLRNKRKTAKYLSENSRLILGKNTNFAARLSKRIDVI